MDGKRYPTRVAGFIGDVVSAGPLQIVPCFSSAPDDARGSTASGWRRRSSSSRSPCGWSPSDRTSPPGLATSRSLRTVSDTATRQELVIGSGPASVLSTMRNFNVGWKATLDGRTLPTFRVDGWAQGWRVAEGDGGRVVISYEPQARYLVLLVGGLVVAGAVPARGAGAAVPDPSGAPGRDPGARASRMPCRGSSPRRWGLLTAGLLVVRAGCSPVSPAVVGVLVAVLRLPGAGRLGALRWLALGLMLAGLCLTAAQLVDRSPAALRRRRPADGHRVLRRR